MKQNGVIETLHFIDVVIIPFEPNQTDLRPTLAFTTISMKASWRQGDRTGKDHCPWCHEPCASERTGVQGNSKDKKSLPFQLMENYIKDSRVDYQRNLSTLSKAYHHPCDAFCEEVLELICNHIGE